MGGGRMEPGFGNVRRFTDVDLWKQIEMVGVHVDVGRQCGRFQQDKEYGNHASAGKFADAKCGGRR